MSTQEDINGIDRPAGDFETSGGGAVVLQKQKLAVNQNGYPLKCDYCRNFMIDPKKHNLLSDDDGNYERHCIRENIKMTICLGCYFPDSVDGIPFGIHGDNYDCRFESNSRRC